MLTRIWEPGLAGFGAVADLSASGTAFGSAAPAEVSASGVVFGSAADGLASVSAASAGLAASTGFAGSAPDLGCYECGQPVRHYGPRP